MGSLSICSPLWFQSYSFQTSRHDLGPRRGSDAAPPASHFNYFYFMLFLIRSRVARYSLLPGSAANAFSMEAIASAFFSTPIATNA